MKGACDIGLKIDWQYEFVRESIRRTTTPGVVYLDTGMNLAPGVIDHHQETGFRTCTSQLVLDNPDLVYNHLLTRWLERYEIGEMPDDASTEVIIRTHVDPDWDGMLAAFWVERLVTDGEIPRLADDLAPLTEKWDQGIEVNFDPLLQRVMPHLLYAAMQATLCADREKIEFGHRLIGFLQKEKEARRGDFRLDDRRMYESEPEFRQVLELLDADLALYKEDLRDAHMPEVELPTRDGGFRRARTLVFGKPPHSKVFKYWMRHVGDFEEGSVDPFEYTIVPFQSGKTADPERIDRVIISVPGDSDLRLYGLGLTLELEEIEEREARGEPIDGPPRFPDFSPSRDPWYDGRTFDYTIVDSPWRGTALSYERIVEIAQSPFYEAPLIDCTLRIVWTLESALDQEVADTGRCLGGHWALKPEFEEFYNGIRNIDLGGSGSVPPDLEGMFTQTRINLRVLPYWNDLQCEVWLEQIQPGSPLTLERLADLLFQIRHVEDKWKEWNSWIEAYLTDFAGCVTEAPAFFVIAQVDARKATKEKIDFLLQKISFGDVGFSEPVDASRDDIRYWEFKAGNQERAVLYLEPGMMQMLALSPNTRIDDQKIGQVKQHALGSFYEMGLYALFLKHRLDLFSDGNGDFSEGMGRDPGSKSDAELSTLEDVVNRLGNEITHFHARYFLENVGKIPITQRVCQGWYEILSIQSQSREVRQDHEQISNSFQSLMDERERKQKEREQEERELERKQREEQNEIEQQRKAREQEQQDRIEAFLNTILFALPLAGLFEVLGVLQGFGFVQKGDFWLWLAGILAGVVLAGFVLYGLLKKRQNKAAKEEG